MFNTEMLELCVVQSSSTKLSSVIVTGTSGLPAQSNGTMLSGDTKGLDEGSNEESERDVEKGIVDKAKQTVPDCVTLKERLSHFTW